MGIATLALAAATPGQAAGGGGSSSGHGHATSGGHSGSTRPSAKPGPNAAAKETAAAVKVDVTSSKKRAGTSTRTSAASGKAQPPPVADGGPAAPLPKPIRANRSRTAVVKGPDTWGSPRGSPFTTQPMYKGPTSTQRAVPLEGADAGTAGRAQAGAGTATAPREREASAPAPKVEPPSRVSPFRVRQGAAPDLSI